MTPIRCHLLIGPPGSGKTTMAALMAPLLNAKVLSTDGIRKELYGDEAIQGDWNDIESRLHQQIRDCVHQEQSVLIDATHAKRAWRLAITQSLELPHEVEWIGWWLQTPKEVCLEWNANRQQVVPEVVIQQSDAALQNSIFGPSRSEGFAALIKFDPSTGGEVLARFQKELECLERRITAARNKEQTKELHGYSRLLDIERLLYLLQLLSRFPGLTATDLETRAELEGICNPLPDGSMADRASAFLLRLRGECYADKTALQSDLNWLDAQGFFAASSIDQALKPPPTGSHTARNLGGWPQMADQQVFVRVMTLLRYLLKNPFDSEKGVSLADHLISSLGDVYLPGEKHTLRKDVENVLTPYGFRARNDNARHGYGLGVAVLPAARLREVHQVVTQAASRLGDPTAQDLLAELNERLHWAGVLNDAYLPLRVFANRSIVHPELVRRESLANTQQAERLEVAIAANQKVVLERFSNAAEFEDSVGGELGVWPLQLIFHNIGWYLAYEEDRVARDRGIIRTERLDRFALRRVESGFSRSSKDRADGVHRLSRLMEISGGIYFGECAETQFNLCDARGEDLSNLLTTVRFRCAEWVYRFLREGLQRYPLNQLRLSKPLPGDSWKPPKLAPLVLEPILNDGHPFPVEIDLPNWTVDRDVDFRRWLFGFGDGVIIESPEALANEHRDKAKGVAVLYE